MTKTDTQFLKTTIMSKKNVTTEDEAIAWCIDYTRRRLDALERDRVKRAGSAPKSAKKATKKKAPKKTAKKAPKKTAKKRAARKSTKSTKAA